MTEAVWPLALALIATAFIYASVGHGGASTYIVILTLFGWQPEDIRYTALLLNLLVSFLAFLQYFKRDEFPFKIFLSLILGSVPAAYIGAGFKPDAHIYHKILGFVLLFPVLRLSGFFTINENPVVGFKFGLSLLMGVLIGFVSGLIGIGGGIILSPLLLLLGWAGVKQTAAISALFIAVNSVSGIAALKNYYFPSGNEWYAILFFCITAGFAGAFLGSKFYTPKVFRYILAGLLLFASVKLIFA